MPAELPLERFQRALRNGRLEVPRCTSCEVLIWYPRARCPNCMSSRQRWVVMSGAGILHSYTVNRRPQGRYRAVGPFVIGYVELDEGLRVLGHVIGADATALRIGQRVKLAGPSRDADAHLRFSVAESPASLR